MGRYYWDKKDTVEDCTQLSIFKLKEFGLLSGYHKYKTDEEIEQEIEKEKEGIEYWKKDKKDLAKMHKNGKSLEVIYDWEDNWGWLCDKVSDFLEDCEEGLEPKEIRSQLNAADWSDDRIWKTLIEICDDKDTVP